MEEKIINEETEEVLENTAGSIPEELIKYLEKDDSAFEEIEKVLSTIDEKKENLNAEKEASEKSFDNRLAEFQAMLAQEKEDTFNEFAKREQDLDAEKAKIEEIKLDEQGKQVNYIDSLKNISDKYYSKINSIEEAIKACEDNDTLAKALEEEKIKLEKALDEEYNSRKEELDRVLVDIGIKEKEPVPEIKPEVHEVPVVEEVKTPVIETPLVEPEINLDFVKTEFNIGDDNEVIDHEPRKDVIAEIYQSKDVMEGHVFPYLKSLL